MTADARHLQDDPGDGSAPRGYDTLHLPRLFIVGGKAVGGNEGGSRARGGEADFTAAAEEIEAAYRRGVQEGMRQGALSAGQQASTAVEALGKALDLFNSSQEQLLRERERDLHALSVAVAQKILQREVRTDPTVVADLVRKALEMLPSDTTLEVRLNPTDMQALQEPIRTMVPPTRGMTIGWSADPTLERGSFLMETPQRLIDGRADIALRELYERMDHNA